MVVILRSYSFWQQGNWVWTSTVTFYVRRQPHFWPIKNTEQWGVPISGMKCVIHCHGTKQSVLNIEGFTFRGVHISKSTVRLLQSGKEGYVQLEPLNVDSLKCKNPIISDTFVLSHHNIIISLLKEEHLYSGHFKITGPKRVRISGFHVDSLKCKNPIISDTFVLSHHNIIISLLKEGHLYSGHFKITGPKRVRISGFHCTCINTYTPFHFILTLRGAWREIYGLCVP